MPAASVSAVGPRSDPRGPTGLLRGSQVSSSKPRPHRFSTSDRARRNASHVDCSCQPEVHTFTYPLLAYVLTRTSPDPYRPTASRPVHRPGGRAVPLVLGASAWPYSWLWRGGDQCSAAPQATGQACSSRPRCPGESTCASLSPSGATRNSAMPDDTVPAPVTARIDCASHQRPDAPISVNSGSRSSETRAGEARTSGSRSRNLHQRLLAQPAHVAILMDTYYKCIHGQREQMVQRIIDALSEDREGGGGRRSGLDRTSSPARYWHNRCGVQRNATRCGGVRLGPRPLLRARQERRNDRPEERRTTRPGPVDDR